MVPSEFQIGLSSALIVWVALLENSQRKEPSKPHLQRERCSPDPRAPCNPCILLSGLGVVLPLQGMELRFAMVTELLLDFSPRGCSKAWPSPEWELQEITSARLRGDERCSIRGAPGC